MGLADKQNTAVADFVKPFLEPGETVTAVVGQVMSGSWPMTSGWAMLINTMVGLVATDRRLIVVGLAKKMTTLPPEKIAGEFPLSAVRVVKFSRGLLSGRLVLDVGEAKPLDFKVQTIYRDGAEGIARAVQQGLMS